MSTALAAAPACGRDLIPFEHFTLPNGLRVIVHEDHKAPIVAVRVAYHVGAKDEPDGQTGFAHLFEHLMFRGSDHFKGDFFQTLDNVGATNVNAETTHDTTQYFETVPAPALELALWMESDRMGHFVGSIDEALLETERSVVQNEKRDREGGPLGGMTGRVAAAIFPAGHPYRRPVLGLMEDLDAASLADLQAWFRKYYGAANAVVVLAGDVDVATARTLMEKYFGDVPAGEPLHRTHSWVPQLSVNIRESIQARVAQNSIQRVWPVPAPNTPDYTLLNMAARILGGSIERRMHGELVEKRKLATGVSVGISPFEIASLFTISADISAGSETAVIERMIDDQLAEFLESGPTSGELQEIKSDLEASLLLGLQRVHDKAALLANAELYAGDPSFNDRTMQWIREATAKDIRRAANEWLGRASYSLILRPFGEYQASAAKFDRNLMPAVADDLELDLPPIREATLFNGMKLVLVERHEVPAVSMTMVFSNAGNHADQDGRRGTASTMYSMMTHGPASLSRATYAQKLDRLHASIDAGAGGRDAASSLSVLKRNLRPALELWEQMLRAPAFRKADFEEWRHRSLQAVDSSRTSPIAVGGRMLRKALYPPGHYLAPTDDQEWMRALEVEDLRRFHRMRLRPDAAKLFVVGDTTLPEMVHELERAFGDWKAPGVAPPLVKAIPAAKIPESARFILIDWPGEPQVQISGGRLVGSAVAQGALPLSAANEILGGGTTARLGQRLRVEKGWSYEIASGTDGGTIQQYWGISTSVQGDRAAESIAEIIDVIARFTGCEPATEAELARFVKGQSRALPGMFENANSVLGAIVQSDAYGRPYDWMEGARARLHALKLEDVNRVARENFTPQSFTWVLVGDLSRFEQKLRDMGLGTVEIWDSEGRTVR